MNNVYDFLWKEFSDFFESLEEIMPDREFGRKFNFDNVSDHDKQIIRELAQRIAYALFFSEDEDGKEVL